MTYYGMMNTRSCKMAIWQVDFSVIDKNKRYDDEDICYWVKEPNNAFDIAFLD